VPVLLLLLLPLPQVGKGFANRAANAANKRAAAAVAEEGSAALVAVFAKGSKAVEDLKKVTQPLLVAVLYLQQQKQEQQKQHVMLCVPTAVISSSSSSAGGAWNSSKWCSAPQLPQHPACLIYRWRCFPVSTTQLAYTHTHALFCYIVISLLVYCYFAPQVSRALRSLPYVDPSLPTLALVGAPNVGKSSLVRVLSSGVPEVCNYPFTTRSIKMGHFYIDGQRHQVGVAAAAAAGVRSRSSSTRAAVVRHQVG
jgi:hypothetical protein